MNVTQLSWGLCLAAWVFCPAHPAGATTVGSAQYSAIAAQLRTIGTALQSYQDDHNGLLPPRLGDLVTGGYLPAAGLLSSADPTSGKQGGIPDTYPWSQYAETDEGGSSYLYEYSEAPCSWFSPRELGDHPSAEDVDLNADGAVSWAEVKQWQRAHGDAVQEPTNRPYDSRRFPVVRCFWFQYPVSWTNGMEPVVLNLAADLRTVFASSPKWERDQLDPDTLPPSGAHRRTGGGVPAKPERRDPPPAPDDTHPRPVPSPGVSQPTNPPAPRATPAMRRPEPSAGKEPVAPDGDRTDDSSLAEAGNAPGTGADGEVSGEDVESLPDDRPLSRTARRAAATDSGEDVAGPLEAAEAVQDVGSATVIVTEPSTVSKPVVWTFWGLAGAVALGLIVWGGFILRKAWRWRGGANPR